MEDFKETVVSRDNKVDTHMMHRIKRDCDSIHETCTKSNQTQFQCRGGDKPRNYSQLIFSGKEKISFLQYRDTEYTIILHGQSHVQK